MKNLKYKIPFILCIVFMFALGVFTLGVGFSMPSYAISLDDISSDVLSSIEVSFNGETKDSNYLFEAEYKADYYELSLSNVATATSYVWYYAANNDYVLIENATNNSIQIKNCKESGSYICAVTTADGVKRTEPININIAPKKIFFTNLKAEDKEYDGTTKINITADPIGIIAGDNVDITIIGNTINAMVGEKRVTITPSDIIFSGEDGSNYIADENLSTDILLVEITPKPLSLVWQTPENKSDYDYTGQDQIGNISVYYFGLSGEKVNLSFSITGYNTLNGVTKNYYDEFLNAGTYTATATLTATEINYDISNLTKVLRIRRINANVNISNTTFTYNALEQDAKSCVSIDNVEQKLIFTDSTFTTVKEGNNKEITVSAEDSLNYLAFSKTFTITVLKATSTIDTTNVKKNYVYTGAVQKINSGATINNNEQVISYSIDNQFLTVAQGNALKVSIYANETDNYNYVSTTFSINVEKGNIDISSWRWNYTKPYIYSKGVAREVYVTGFPRDKVSVVYEDCKATDVGVYQAKAKFTLLDTDNYNPLSEFPDLIWRINKQTVIIPIAENTTTTYNGETQVLNIATSSLYSISGNGQKNAGKYIVNISLNDNKNFEWNNGSSNDLSINWIIEKLKVATPQFDLENYDGTEESINISKDSPYYIIYGDEKFILLGLNDENNYAWEDSDRAYLRIDIGGGFFDGPALPIVAISLTLITLILICIYFAVHSVIILKRHRKKIALLKARKLKKLTTLASGDDLTSGTNFTTTYEEQEPKKVKQQKLVDDKIHETNLNKETIQSGNVILNNKENSSINKEEVNNEILEEANKDNTKNQDVISKEIINKEESVKELKKTNSKTSNEPKTRKPYAKSRKIESKKKVAAKKRESNAKKIAAKKEAEKKKNAVKKSKAKTTAKSSKNGTNKKAITIKEENN